MNSEQIEARIRGYFGADLTALAAAIHEVELSRTPAYLDAILAEGGSPANREEALLRWSMKRGELWRR
jgi:hypothetical protein